MEEDIQKENTENFDKKCISQYLYFVLTTEMMKRPKLVVLTLDLKIISFCFCFLVFLCEL